MRIDVDLLRFTFLLFSLTAGMFFFGSEAHFPTLCSNWTGIVKSHYGLLGLIAPNHCSARAVLIAFNGICWRGWPSLLLPANLGSYLVLRSPDCFILGDIQHSKSNLRTGLLVDHYMWLLPMVANHRSNDAMFAMYHSSLLCIHAFLSIMKNVTMYTFSRVHFLIKAHVFF